MDIKFYENKKRKNENEDILEIMPIGAGSEVGRSCILLKYKEKIVMFDCGIHPAYTGLSALPYFDMIDPSKIDILLISHFHLDHCAALPYFLHKTTFRGRVFMTHPTKAIYKMILTDYLKVSNIVIEEMLYDEQDLVHSMKKIEVIDYHQEIEIDGIKFCCYNAGHVLGAAMFMVEIAGVRVLYTGDFSRQEDRHLMAAEIPPIAPDILIVESTYGVQIHPPRDEREKRFTSLVHTIVQRGGRCLIPVFALGRAQELLLILDEYWESHPELHHIPIYYASTLAKKCMTVYQTYINMMNEKIRQQFAISNPFIFKHISNLKSMEHFQDIGPCVVMASPGMLQNGLSRELFELWCTDKKNGVILPGYCVEGTLAKQIMSEPSEIKTLNGQKLPLKLSVNYISFSAHSDFLQTSEFIDQLLPPYVVLVHGDSNEMKRLKNSLIQKYQEANIHVFSPKNGEAVQLQFRAEKIAKIVGSLASSSTSDRISGLLVVKNFNDHIMHPNDLNTFTQLTTSQITQRIFIPYHQNFELLKENISQMYEDIKCSKKDSFQTLRIYDSIDLSFDTTKNSNNLISLEWISDPVNDMIADSIIAIILQIEQNPVQIIPKNEIQIDIIYELLKKQFGQDLIYDKNQQTIQLNVDNSSCIINLLNQEILNCNHNQLKEKMEIFLTHLHHSQKPL